MTLKKSNLKMAFISAVYGVLLYTYNHSVFAEDNDPNLNMNNDGAAYRIENPNSGPSLHESTNPVVDTGVGYYIPGDQNFDRQTNTYEEAESRRSTTYSDNAGNR